jgi:hypothetical protein
MRKQIPCSNPSRNIVFDIHRMKLQPRSPIVVSGSVGVVERNKPFPHVGGDKVGGENPSQEITRAKTCLDIAR